MSPVLSDYPQTPEQRNPMTQQDKDPRIEAAAKALYCGRFGTTDDGWGRLNQLQKGTYVSRATPIIQALDALEAAEDAKPDPRVEVLAKALFKSNYRASKWKRATPYQQARFRRLATDGLAAMDKAEKA